MFIVDHQVSPSFVLPWSPAKAAQRSRALALGGWGSRCESRTSTSVIGLPKWLGSSLIPRMVECGENGLFLLKLSFVFGTLNTMCCTSFSYIFSSFFWNNRYLSPRVSFWLSGAKFLGPDEEFQSCSIRLLMVVPHNVYVSMY